MFHPVKNPIGQIELEELSAKTDSLPMSRFDLLDGDEIHLDVIN